MFINLELVQRPEDGCDMRNLPGDGYMLIKNSAVYT